MFVQCDGLPVTGNLEVLSCEVPCRIKTILRHVHTAPITAYCKAVSRESSGTCPE